jgi:PST family polysaccharide transporter
MRALYVFGLHAGLAQLLNFFAYNTDSYIIGTRWGASTLGIYNRAFQMFTMPSSQLLAPLTNVALPLLSQRRHAGGDFYPLLLKAQVTISVALTAMFSLAASLAQPLVAVALGPEWNESAALLSILSMGGAVQVMSYMTFWAFLASGNTRQLFFAGLVTRSLLVLCIAIGSLAGIEGVAWGFTAGLTIAWFINLAWLKQCDSMPVRVFFISGSHVLLCGLTAGLIGWILVWSFDSSASSAILLFTGSLLVTAIYIALIVVNRTTRNVLREAIGPAIARLRRVLRCKFNGAAEEADR